MTDNVLRPIERSNLVDQVVREIVDAVLAGQYPPGARLIEMKIGKQMGVSRGPVREAFRRLEQIGFVVKIPYRGTFVTTLSADDVQELHDLRAPLEGLAARLVAEKRDPKAIAKLADILETIRLIPPSGDRNLTMNLVADFHDTLITLTGHRLLQELWVIVGLRLRNYLMLNGQQLYKTPQDIVALHEPIVEAISSGDSLVAEQTAWQHVAAVSERHIDV